MDPQHRRVPTSERGGRKIAPDEKGLSGMRRGKRLEVWHWTTKDGDFNGREPLLTMKPRAKINVAHCYTKPKMVKNWKVVASEGSWREGQWSNANEGWARWMRRNWQRSLLFLYNSLSYEPEKERVSKSCFGQTHDYLFFFCFGGTSLVWHID